MSALTAALLLMLFGAGLVAVGVAGGRNGQAIINRRINLVLARPAAAEAEAPAAIRWLPRAEAAMERLFAFGLKRRWGASTRGRILVAFGAVSALGAWLLLRGIMGVPLWMAAILTLATFVAVPRAILSVEQTRADIAFTDRFPDAIDMVIRTLRAGLPVTTAIRTAASDASPPVNTVFATLADRIDMGMPLDEALAFAGERIQLADFRFFTVAVALQHSTGGNLAATLEILSEIIRKRRAERLKARAVTAEVRMTAYVLAGIPFVIIGGLLLVQPHYLAPLIHDPRGQIITGLAVTGMIAGFATMRHMMRSVTAV